MQISLGDLLRVIFMLSTIVTGTDCCSSRILFLKEHTLKVVHDHGFFNDDLDATRLNEHRPPHHRHHHHIDLLEELKNQTQPIELVGSAIGVIAIGKSDNEPETAIPKTPIDGAPPTPTPSSTPSQPSSPLPSASPSPSEPPSQQPTATELFDVLDPGSESSLQTEKQPIDSSAAVSEKYDEIGSSTPSPSVDTVKEFITDPAIRAMHTGNPTYHPIDYYYKVMRDVLLFECDGQYGTDFCLNQGRCFRFPLGNHSFFSCECAEGYVGERCESKSLNGQYVPAANLDAKPKIVMARIVFSFPMLIALSVIYIACGAVIVLKCPNNANSNKQRAAGMLAG